jgi:hypothetical protein
MTYKKNLPLVLVFIATLFQSFSPVEDISDRVIAGLKKYVEEYPQEKVYVHLDKPSYAAGEVVWFKAYLTAGSYHQPSPLSYTINVELMNSKKEIVQSSKLKSDNGFAHGYFALPDSLESGEYVMRAYTPWMQNFDDSYFFYKQVRILGHESVSPAPVADQSIDLQFFPEGGSLITGLETRIGFKAIGSDGLSRNVKFRIIDQSGSEIRQVESRKFGMGFFPLIAEAGKKYFAELEGGKKYELPASQATGFLVAVTNKPEQPEVIVRIQSNDATANRQQVLVVAQTRGVVSYMVKANVSTNRVFVKIPKDKLVSGITQLTLFDGQGTPVAERLVFVDHDDAVRVTVTPDKSLYKPREKVELTIRATDKNGDPVAGNFSVAVTDESQVSVDRNDLNIIAHLWLASDIRGKIENAGYYFNRENADRHELLDVLLMTQGWRRFVWNDLLSDKWPETKHAIDRGFKISGKLVDILTKKPVADGKVTFLSTDPASGGIMIVKTATDGSFELSDLNFYDSADVVLQGENKRGNKTINFQIKEEEKPALSYTFSHPQHDKTELDAAYVKNSIERQRIDAAYNFDERTIMLQEVQVSAKKIDDEAQAKKIYGSGNATLKMSDMPAAATLSHPLQVLQGRVAGVMVTGSGLSYNVTIRGVGSLSNNEPLYMIDNVQVDATALNSLSPRDIESIEIFKGAEAAVFGSASANGAILFYTKKGKYSAGNRMGIINLKFAGYATPRQFYIPAYNEKKPEHEKPDRRVTVLWAPVVKTDSTGSTKVSFFNADTETSLSGKIEGLTGYGNPGVGSFRYEVSKH